MACKINRDSNNNITKVMAPNGEPSKLYNSLVELAKENIEPFKTDPYINKVLDEGLIKDASPEELALAAWSKVYTPEFKEKFPWSEVEPHINDIEDSILNYGTSNVYFELTDLKELDNDVLPKLREFVNSQGFKVEDLSTYIEDYKARTGKDFTDQGINSLIDFTQKAIAVKEGKNAAFNEEAVHLAIALSPKGPKFERALESIP